MARQDWLSRSLNNLLGPYGARSVEKLRAQLQQTAERERAKLQEDLTADAERVRSRYQRELETYRQELAENTNAAAARRAYEYEARKRLYSQVEPLLFHLHESLEEAHYRVRSLARTSRSGNLRGGRASWLGGDGYYLRSTMYKLVLPVVHFRLMQRRVTFVDLTLDDSIGLRYKLMKLYVRSFTDDFTLANFQPAIAYNPNVDHGTGVRAEPRQALVLGDLENVADLLIVGADDSARAMQFGEFEALLDATPRNESLGELVAMFLHFSPESRPVLARLLMAQACLAYVILSVYHSPADAADLTERLRAFATSDEAIRELGWSDTDRRAPDLDVALRYWSERLQWLRENRAIT